MTSEVLGARWIGHPLLGTLSAQRQLTAYLKFKIWNIGAQKFEDDLPAGIHVSLVDGSPLRSNDTLATVKTDANGVASFNIPDLTPQFPDMYFVVNTAELPRLFGGHPTLPEEWSTKGWRSSDGKELGYKEKFAGTTFGTSANPIEFEIGVSLFLAVSVESTTEPGQPFMPLLPNTRITLYAGGLFNPVLTLEEEVDALGIAKFFSFEVKPDSNITLELKAKNDSTGKKGFPFLQNVYVDDWPGIPPGTWKYLMGTELTNLANNDKTSIGSKSTAYPIKLAIANSAKTCAAFTCLKNLAELNCLLHFAIPSQDWHDYSGNHINLRAFLAGGLSLPGGSINFPESFEDWRGGQVHEFAHQILWLLGGFSVPWIAYTYCLGEGIMNHDWYAYYNPKHALLEGWPECFRFIFDINKFNVTKIAGKFQIGYGTRHEFVVDEDGNEWGPLEPNAKANWGESVEGMFAAGLFHLFRDYVMPSGTAPLSGALIPTGHNGDISKHPYLKWLTDTTSLGTNARERFRKIFVAPAKAMAGTSPTTTDFIQAIRKENTPPNGLLAEWTKIRTILQHFYLATPAIESISPREISKSGGTPVEINGRHFYQDPGTVSFGLNKATITSFTTKKITCTAPAGTLGSVDLKLVTADGVVLMPFAMTYV